jgi:hypothetical protein
LPCAAFGSIKNSDVVDVYRHNKAPFPTIQALLILELYDFEDLFCTPRALVLMADEGNQTRMTMR